MNWLSALRSLKSKTRREEAEYREELHKTGLEKGDIPAMVLSAFLVFLPVAGVLLLLFWLVSLLFM